MLMRITRGGHSALRFARPRAFRNAPLRSIVRVAEWRVRCWLGRPVVIDWPGHEPLRIALPAVWTSAYVATFALRGGHPDDRELVWLRDRLGTDAVFVDIGANIGQWTIPIARTIQPRGGSVVAVEPAAATAAALRRSIEANGLHATKVVQVALSERDSVARLHHHGRDPSQHSLGDVGPGSEEVRTRSLDSLLRSDADGRVDAVKIDVEGAEEVVLRGATHMLSVHRPIIVFEVRKGLPERLGLAADGAWRLLLAADYRCFRLGDGASLDPIEPEALASQSYGWNIIAIPHEGVAGQAA